MSFKYWAFIIAFLASQTYAGFEVVNVTYTGNYNKMGIGSLVTSSQYCERSIPPRIIGGEKYFFDNYVLKGNNYTFTPQRNSSVENKTSYYVCLDLFEIDNRNHHKRSVYLRYKYNHKADQNKDVIEMEVCQHIISGHTVNCAVNGDQVNINFN